MLSSSERLQQAVCGLMRSEALLQGTRMQRPLDPVLILLVRLLLVHYQSRVKHLECVNMLQLFIAAQSILSAERYGHEVVLSLDTGAHLTDPGLQRFVVVRGANLGRLGGQAEGQAKGRGAERGWWVEGDGNREKRVAMGRPDGKVWKGWEVRASMQRLQRTASFTVSWSHCRKFVSVVSSPYEPVPERSSSRVMRPNA